MIKQTCAIAILVSSLLAACNDAPKGKETPAAETKQVADSSTQNVNAIPYSIAKNYFVLNTVKSIAEPKIETAEKFKSIFGAAATMGKEGAPTVINFAKQYVIAIMQPETSVETHITSVALQKAANGDIEFTYKIEKGAKQSFTTLPCLAIIVDKADSGKLVLKEQ